MHIYKKTFTNIKNKMIQINNKYDFNQYVNYRIWEPLAHKYSNYSGRIVGINCINMQNRITILYGLIKDNEWTNEEEIKSLGVDSDYEYYMKYYANSNEPPTVKIDWIEENDILK